MKWDAKLLVSSYWQSFSLMTKRDKLIQNGRERTSKQYSYRSGPIVIETFTFRRHIVMSEFWRWKANAYKYIINKKSFKIRVLSIECVLLSKVRLQVILHYVLIRHTRGDIESIVIIKSGVVFSSCDPLL